jgi:hypothetical protein
MVYTKNGEKHKRHVRRKYIKAEAYVVTFNNYNPQVIFQRIKVMTQTKSDYFSYR